MITQISNLRIKIVGLIIALIVSIKYANADVVCQTDKDIFVEQATIIYNPLLSFLKNRIVPFAKANEFNKNNDFIEISIHNENHIFDNVRITIISSCACPENYIADEMIDKSKKIYITLIDDIPIYILTSNESINIVRPTNKRFFIGKAENNLRSYISCDSELTLLFKAYKSILYCYNYYDIGLSWLRKTLNKKYLSKMLLWPIDDTTNRNPLFIIQPFTEKSNLPTKLQP